MKTGKLVCLAKDKKNINTKKIETPKTTHSANSKIASLYIQWHKNS